MPLKRGLERRSCDFCFRRKIKCDRPIRATQGFDKCSQCEARREQCRLDDSSDLRVQRRRTMNPGSGEAEIGKLAHHSLLHGDRGQRANQEQLSECFASTPHPGNVLPVEHGHATSSQYPDSFFFDDDLTLSNDSMLFLEQVFMGGSLTTEWTDGMSMTNVEDTTPDSAANNTEDRQAEPKDLDKINIAFPDDDALVIMTGLHAYFDYAASYLPILVADAFWTDFRAGRCSSSLLYAVACRGMPFTRVANKWELQQHLARTFREIFLQVRAVALDDSGVGLDDLEALALMIDFQYDDAGTPPLHANLGRLFLTHESLVLMMLRSHKHEYGKSNAQSSATLARANERRMLLSWHVYGIDAFHCLDRKQQSLIPDIDVIGNESSPQHEAKDYFDAILALAIIARKITRTLCSATARLKGVNPNDVRSMYEQIALWRSHSCPPHLRRYRDGASNLVAWDTNNSRSAQETHLQLRRAVLCALEINCTMQIEACVSASRLQVDSAMDTEQVSLQIDFESVRALNDMKGVCEWMRKLEAESYGTAHHQHSLVDLAPNILRNACAGLCFWACQRGIDICEGRGRSFAFHAYAGKGGRKERHAEMYKNTAQLLRDCVATAVSHKDTMQVLQRLDGQRALLDNLLQQP